jgi:protein SCO1
MKIPSQILRHDAVEGQCAIDPHGAGERVRHEATRVNAFNQVPEGRAVRAPSIAPRAPRHGWVGVAIATFGLALATAALAHDESHFDYKPPPPGGYRLEHILPPPQGTVLDVDGRPQLLLEFVIGKITLLSFMYTTCKDPSGCPLAYQVMVDLKRAIIADPDLKGQVRFVTLSFDPEHDTPAKMKLYGGSHVRKTEGLEWYFLTTQSRGTLLPILTALNQDVSPSVDPALGPYTHVVKLFLIDPEGWVREIYDTSYLHPETMLNDMRTLVIEERQRR